MPHEQFVIALGYVRRRITELKHIIRERAEPAEDLIDLECIRGFADRAECPPADATW